MTQKETIEFATQIIKEKKCNIIHIKADPCPKCSINKYCSGEGNYSVAIDYVSPVEAAKKYIKDLI